MIPYLKMYRTYLKKKQPKGAGIFACSLSNRWSLNFNILDSKVKLQISIFVRSAGQKTGKQFISAAHENVKSLLEKWIMRFMIFFICLQDT